MMVQFVQLYSFCLGTGVPRLCAGFGTVDCSRVRTRIRVRGSTVYGIPLHGLRPVRTRLQSTVRRRRRRRPH